MNLSVRLRLRLSDSFTLEVDFAATPGVTILFGESGSGKTTLLRSIAGFTRPNQGRVAVGERVLYDSASGTNVDPSLRRVGFVFQDLALFPHLSGAKNIEYGLAGLDRDERSRRTSAIAHSFDIVDVLGRRPKQISGGERQRVGLARTLVTNPDVLLLDEPLSALDRRTQSRIMADLQRWNLEHQIPILYVTHSIREAYALGDRVLALDDGAIVGDGTPEQVIGQWAPGQEH
jgi:molybdate transport system ATP-binding protein